MRKRILCVEWGEFTPSVEELLLLFENNYFLIIITYFTFFCPESSVMIPLKGGIRDEQ